MEGVRTFLESSTIHGLTYISTTRKYARIFWILVVITGFVGASLIIKESFESWSESPVKTTTETLPISELKLPKVTVCPPKNTFTDLNYDLMMTENMTMTEKMRDEMFKYALEVINEDSFSENNWTKLHEENRFYNWYHGYTQIESPHYADWNGVNYNLPTSASSGVVSTQYYGEPFRPELVERKLHYNVGIYPPLNAREDENVTLHFKVERVSMNMTGLTKGSWEDFGMIGHDLNDQRLDADQTTVYANFTAPAESKSIQLDRKMSSEDVEAQKLAVMPGFRLTWWFSGREMAPHAEFKDNYYSKLNKHFTRLAET